VIAIVDVHYFDDGTARAACVVAERWTDATTCEEPARCTAPIGFRHWFAAWTRSHVSPVREADGAT